MSTKTTEVILFDDLGRGDVARVGGKNASLGEMVVKLSERGVAVPPGFATTAEAYWRFVDANGLLEPMQKAFNDLQAGRAYSAPFRSLILF